MTTTTPTSFILGRACTPAGALFFMAGLVFVSSLSTADPASRAGAVLAGPAVIVDGDTLEVAGRRIRLEGIDAPETAQTCGTASGEQWPCGRAATKALSQLIGTAEIACDVVGNDKYNRVLAVCYAEGQELNATLVATGSAWAFVKYSTRYVAEEDAARRAALGIWQGPAEPPWDYRRKGWQVAEAQAPGGCAIKGNVSSKGRVYHMPWSPWYDRVTVEQRRGERWFCSEDEAQAAGWRPVQQNLAILFAFESGNLTDRSSSGIFGALSIERSPGDRRPVVSDVWVSMHRDSDANDRR